MIGASGRTRGSTVHRDHERLNPEVVGGVTHDFDGGRRRERCAVFYAELQRDVVAHHVGETRREEIQDATASRVTQNQSRVAFHRHSFWLKAVGDKRRRYQWSQ